jgi:iron uptake system component EfeO
MNTRLTLLALVTAGALAACSPAADDASSSSNSRVTAGDGKSDADYEAEVVRGLHDSIMTDIVNMEAALTDIQSAAPTGRGWDPVTDAAALDTMRSAWIRARQAYERIEGVVAPVFPEIDVPLDERYEGFLATLGATGDQYLFDNHGVTGMHAIERILYVATTPDRVVTSERALPGYKAAALPATAQEAADFKSLLCGKALSDAALLHREWDGAVFDASLAFQGLVDLMIEQREKVNKASSNEEESRYSQRTMDDLRENLAGTKRAYEIFAPWIVSKAAPAVGAQSGHDIDSAIRTGMGSMNDSYSAQTGDAIPQPPDDWSADPTPADLATPFGKLYTLVRASVNPNISGSVVGEMNSASDLLGFPQQ